MGSWCFVIRLKRILLICGLSGPVLGGLMFADVSDDAVRAALERLESGALADWSFQADYLRGETVRTLQFGAGLPTEREVQLISVDGRELSTEELAEFEEEQEKAKSENGDDFGLSDLITEGSLEYVREDEAGTHFHFIPRFAIEGDPEPQEALVGELVLDRISGYIRELEVRSDGVFKPRFGVKLNKLRMGFRFQLLDDGTLAPESMITEIKGRAFLVANFDEKVQVRYHTFEKVNTGEAPSE